MAKRKIEIELRAKNAMQRGLSQAGAAVKKFGQSALNIGKFFAKGFLAAGAAVAGFAAKALHAYAQQEAAERSVIAAMNAHGEAGEALLPVYRRIASAIQDETGAADEATLASMANMRMLGVRTDQMEQATKGLIGLKAAGMEGATAERAMAAAMQGNYSMLTRYIPALRDAKDEAEKARIVNDFVTKGYAQQAGQLDTVAGQWGLLKGRVGDVWEEIGRAIAQNDTLMESLKRAGEAVKAFGERVSEWVEGGGMVNLIAGFKMFYAEVRSTFQLISNTAAIAFASIADGAETVVRYIQGVFEANAQLIAGNFTRLAEAAKAAWEMMRRPSRENARAMAEASRQVYEGGKDDLQNLARAYAGHGAAVTKRTAEQLDEREEIHRERTERLKEISAEQAAALIAHNEQVAQRAKEAAAAETAAAAAAAGEKAAAAVASAAKAAAKITEIEKARAGTMADNEERITAKMREENEKRVSDAEDAASGIIRAQERVVKRASAGGLKAFARTGLSTGAPIGHGMSYADMQAMQGGRRAVRNSDGSISYPGEQTVRQSIGVMGGGTGIGVMQTTLETLRQMNPARQWDQMLVELKGIHQDQKELLRWH